MKSDAPAFMARIAIGTSLCPVITMAGRAWPAARSCSSRSMPLTPGSAASMTRQAATPGRKACRNASPLGKPATVRPSLSSTSMIAPRTPSSSSTTKITGCRGVWRHQHARDGRAAARGARRLAQQGAPPLGHGAQCDAGDVSCQDDHRQRSAGCRPNSGRQLQPIRAVGKVVIGQNQVGHAARHTLQRPRAIRRCRDLVTLATEQLSKHLSQVRIILHDQDPEHGTAAGNFWPGRWRMRCRSPGNPRQLDREPRAMAEA